MPMAVSPVPVWNTSSASGTRSCGLSLRGMNTLTSLALPPLNIGTYVPHPARLRPCMSRWLFCMAPSCMASLSSPGTTFSVMSTIAKRPRKKEPMASITKSSQCP